MIKKMSDKQREKRNQIFQAATELFSFQGFYDTTISQIAKASGVSFGTVFTYFETKEELFKAVTTEPLEEFKKLYTDYLITEDWSLEVIETIVEKHILYFAHKRMYLHLIQQVLGQTERFSELFGILDKTADDFRLALIPLITKGQQLGLFEEEDSDIVARSYFSFLIGMRLTHTDDSDSPVWLLFKPILLRILGYRKGRV